MGTKKIEVYVDIASYYSYIAFVQLQLNRELLTQNSVEVDLLPTLIAAINGGSGNKPPWTLKAKSDQLNFDTRRIADALGLGKLSPPGPLMEVGMTTVPMRAVIYVKSKYPPETFTAALAYLYHSFWSLHRAPNTPAALAEVLAEIPAGFRTPLAKQPRSPSYSSPASLPLSVSSSESGSGSKNDEKLFTSAQVKEIVDATSTAEMKSALKAGVAEALARGAYGLPWIWATNAEGKSEPFFGSDRWQFVYDFLGLPYGDVRLLAPGDEKKKALL